MMFLTVKVVDTSNESCSIGKRSEAAPPILSQCGYVTGMPLHKQ